MPDTTIDINNYLFQLFRYTFEHLDKGRYVFRVRSISLAQTGSYTDYTFLVVYDPSYSTLSIIGMIFAGILFTVFIVTVIIYFYRLSRKRVQLRSINASTQNIMMQMDEFSTGTPQDEEAPSFYHTHDDHEFF